MSDSIQVIDDTITICEIVYSMEIFRQLGGLLPVGQSFRLESRKDCVICLVKVSNE